MHWLLKDRGEKSGGSMERAIAPNIPLQKNRDHYSNSYRADENTSCTAGPMQPTRSGQISMLPGTLTHLCWRRLACPGRVTSICVAHPHSCRVWVMGCETGACPTG